MFLKLIEFITTRKFILTLKAINVINNKTNKISKKFPICKDNAKCSFKTELPIMCLLCY